MRTRISTIILFFFIFSNLYGQKKSVGFAPFSYNQNSASQESALTIYNYVVQAFDATQRFSVKDRIYGYQIVSNEQELNKSEQFMDGDVLVSKGKMEDAEWMVSGQIMAATAVPTEEGTYQSNIAFFIRVYDVVTGEVVASQIISENGGTDFTGNVSAADNIGKDNGFFGKLFNGGSTTGTGTNKQEALAKGMMNLLPHLKTFVREKFPFEFEEYQIQTDEFGTKKVLVLGNEQMGAELGQVIDVIHLDEVVFGDKTITAKRHKGELKIDELGGQIFYLVPKNKKNDFILTFMEENKGKIILRESGEAAGLFDTSIFGNDPEKKKLRKDERKKKRNKKSKD